MRRVWLGLALALIVLIGWVVVEPILRPPVVVLLFHKTPEFETAASYLEQHGYHTLRLKDFRAFLRGTGRVPPRSVLLTFDDGDATNYAGAAEALQRHHQSGVYFLIADRPGGGAPRPLASDSAGEADTWRIPHGDADMYAARHPRSPDPYSMLWSEARRMRRMGVAELESHTATHSFAFRSDSLRQFLGRPDWKSVDALGGDARRGAPVFAGHSALLGPAFRPDSALVSALASAARRSRGPLPVDSLQEVVRQFRMRQPLGRSEAVAEYEARLGRELAGARRRLQDSLGTTVDALAWPWGQYDAGLVRRARAAGYTMLFTTRPWTCEPGTDSLEVPRVAARPDLRWLRGELWIYSYPALARFYARLHPQPFPM